MTQKNIKLEKENRELTTKCKDLQEMLSNKEAILSDKLIENAEKDDTISMLRNEVAAREAEVQTLTEKNKKLTSECSVLTNKVLEERNKMIEIMNEANSMYEDVNGRFGESRSSSFAKGP